MVIKVDKSIVCCTCEETIKKGSRYVLQGNGDIHHDECFDDFADEAYRYKNNDYGYYILDNETEK